MILETKCLIIREMTEDDFDAKVFAISREEWTNRESDEVSFAHL